MGDTADAMAGWELTTQGYVRGPWRIYQAETWCVALRTDTERMVARGFAAPEVAAASVSAVSWAALGACAPPAHIAEWRYLESLHEYVWGAWRMYCAGTWCVLFENRMVANGFVTPVKALAWVLLNPDRWRRGRTPSSRCTSRDCGQPIPLLLHCPLCSERHIDEGEFATKLHHTHACQRCGHVWRPAVVATVGVRFLPGFKDAS